MLKQEKTDLLPFSELARKFALSSLKKNRYDNDKYPFGDFYHDALLQAHKLGLFSITLPADCGGSELGLEVLCVILDEISRVDASMAGIIFTHAFAQELLLQAGCRDHMRAIHEHAAGAVDALIAFSVFSNPVEVEHDTLAVKEGNGYVLNGPLEYLVLGALAEQALIPAKISGQEGFSLFLVKIDQNGITKSGPVASLGLHACPAVDISFNAVTAEIVGAEGRGQQYYEAAADRFSVAAAAISSGIMKGAFQEAHAYSAERFQGGRAIIDWSMLRMILADMAVKVEIADMAVTQACRALAEASPRASLQARAAALHVQELSTSLTTDGIQVLGGYGYMKDFGQEKRFRDSKQAQSLLGLFPMKKLKYIEYLRNE